MKRTSLPLHFSAVALCALTFSGLACAQKPAPALRTLNVQGEVYASACTPQNKSALQAKLTGDVWPLVETLLCEKKSPSSVAYVSSHIGKTVKYETTSTGSPDRAKKIAVNAELIDSLLSEGEAWGADATVEKKQIVIKFMPNEACVRTSTVQLVKKTWTITELSEACD